MSRRLFRGQPSRGDGGLNLGIRMPRPAAAGGGGDVAQAATPLDVLIDAPDGVVDEAYAHTYSATGGGEPYTWALTPGDPSILDVLSFDAATATFSGTPGAESEGVYQFLVDFQDAAGNRVRAGDAIKITGDLGPLTLTGTPPDGATGVPYDFTWTLTGGTPPYDVSMFWQTEENGLLESAGPPPSVSGTPVAAAAVTIEIFVQDSADLPNTVTETFTWSFFDP
jgi:hypothetical protein